MYYLKPLFRGKQRTGKIKRFQPVLPLRFQKGFTKTPKGFKEIKRYSHATVNITCFPSFLKKGFIEGYPYSAHICLYYFTLKIYHNMIYTFSRTYYNNKI